MPGGGIVPVTDDDLDHLPLATAHAIELLGTAPARAFDPRQVGAASYYLAASAAPAAVRQYSSRPSPAALRSPSSSSPCAATVNGSACSAACTTPWSSTHSAGAMRSVPRLALPPLAPRLTRRR